MKISVIIKEPGGKPRHVHVENSLENLQKIVGGYIETVTIAEDAVIICNEEGRLLGMPYCCTICEVDFVGPVILAGVSGEDLADWPISRQDTKRVFTALWA